VLDPVKSGYDVLEREAAGWARVVPPGADYWDDDSKLDFPLRYYYQEVRGLRPDVTLHHMFSPFLDEDIARSHALDIRDELQAKHRVVISSTGWPESMVLAALSRMLDHGVDLVPLPLGEGLPALYELRLPGDGPPS
jgi:hypothetical protein